MLIQITDLQAIDQVEELQDCELKAIVGGAYELSVGGAYELKEIVNPVGSLEGGLNVKADTPIIEPGVWEVTLGDNNFQIMIERGF